PRCIMFAQNAAVVGMMVEPPGLCCHPVHHPFALCSSAALLAASREGESFGASEAGPCHVERPMWTQTMGSSVGVGIVLIVFSPLRDERFCSHSRRNGVPN